jgi:uncharacterized damage-inducible protein DinB
MPGTVRPVTDERDGLLAFLDHQRYLVRVAAHGLSNTEAFTTSTASSLTVGGLIKHLASVEHGWMDLVEQRRNEASVEAYLSSFSFAPDDTLSDVLAGYDAAARRTTEVVARIADLGQPVPIPSDQPWFPRDVTAWSVRWVLLHLIEETARHAGHADIIRESLDGGTAIPLMAAVEGWPATPWVEPWRPAVAR